MKSWPPCLTYRSYPRKTTAFKAALDYVMQQGEEEKKSLEGIAATLTVLLEKVLDEEQNMEGQDS